MTAPPPPAAGALTAGDRARAAWGDALPDWVLVLAQACDEASANQVARRLDLSAATISQVIRNKYGANTTGIAARVAAVLQGARVACPLFDAPIPAVDCRDTQHRPYTPSNPWRVKQWRACRNCPNARRRATS